MTRFTEEHLFPYPTPGQFGWGAIDLQKLAERADEKLDGLDADWPGRLARPSVVVQPSADITGIAANVNHFINFNAAPDFIQGGLDTSSGRITVDTDGSANGWYLIEANLFCQPAGARNNGTVRRCELFIEDFSTPVVGSIITEIVAREDYESGAGITAIYVATVSLLRPGIQAEINLAHLNTSSTMTVLAANTWFAAHQIIPEE